MLIIKLTNDQQSSSGQASFNSPIDPPADSEVNQVHLLKMEKNIIRLFMKQYNGENHTCSIAHLLAPSGALIAILTY